MKDLMTRRTLATNLEVSIPTIIRWEKLGLPVIRIGGIVRYDPLEVEKWITLNKFSQEVSK